METPKQAQDMMPNGNGHDASKVDKMDAPNGTGEHAHTHGTHHHHGHMVHLDEDYDPMKWPLQRKVYTSTVAWLFTFALLFNATSISTGIPQIMTDFNVSIYAAIVPFSLFIFGIAFAPTYTPHLSERFGRVPVYFVGTFISSMFLLGASRSHTFAALAATRFFAGFFQGPVVVLLEGTFADIWPAAYTGTYYLHLLSSQYVGAASGAVIGGVVVLHKGWRWSQYVGLMINLLALVYGVGVPETYPRQIYRTVNTRKQQPYSLGSAASGSTLPEMAKLTLIDPIIMLFSEPLVIMLHLSLVLNFGVTFQFFVLVPQVLKMLAKFDSAQSGYAFIAAYGGIALAFVAGVVLDQITTRANMKRGKATIEHRMLPAMLGSLLMVASLFWIAWTARPGYHYTTPIVGTAFFVWGSAANVAAYVGYLFDAYPPAATLSALTACAVTRVLAAGWFPLFILKAVGNIGGSWTLSAFGFCSAGVAVIPFVIFFFGERMRSKSRYGGSGMMNTLQMQIKSEGGDMQKDPMA